MIHNRTTIAILGLVALGAGLMAPLLADKTPSPATAPADPNADTPEDLATLKLLDEHVKEISADRQGLEKCLDFLREGVPLKMDIRWKVLEAAGVDRSTPVTMQLRDTPLRRVLTTMLTDVGGDLDFVVEEGVVVISSRDDLQTVGHRVTRVYNVRDLVSDGSTTRPAQAALVTQLRDLLQQKTADGKIDIGTLSEFNGLFIVETNRHTQRQIADLLAKLRAADKASTNPGR